jgi:hypothetical protein
LSVEQILIEQINEKRVNFVNDSKYGNQEPGSTAVRYTGDTIHTVRDDSQQWHKTGRQTSSLYNIQLQCEHISNYISTTVSLCIRWKYTYHYTTRPREKRNLHRWIHRANLYSHNLIGGCVLEYIFIKHIMNHKIHLHTHMKPLPVQSRNAGDTWTYI